MRRSNRTSFFAELSLRRLLLEGRRAARGGPSNRCDVEKGVNSSSKGDKASLGASSHNSKHHNDTSSLSNASPKCSNPSSTNKASSSSVTASRQLSSSNLKECQLCYMNYEEQPEFLYTLLACKHTACRVCLESYLTIEITESRTDIACPSCDVLIHQSDIQTLLKPQPAVIAKYEEFMVRRVLLSEEPHARWCPAPNCGYAVIATGCASCPLIKCERPGCGVQFCYHCKNEWHENLTCSDAARATSRQSPTRRSGSISQDSQHRDDIKPCPRCRVLIVKMDDGSCNHMVCAVCGSEFCWLCMKEITDLHYLSPSGCTFWGTKPWSRKKKLLWQLGTLVGAPVAIALVASISVPSIIIGIPVWVGRKIHNRYLTAGKHKRNFAVLGGVAASVLISPVLAGLAVAIGVPILLFYVYGVVPVSLCRAGCGVKDDSKYEFDEEDVRNHDAVSVDAVSRTGGLSIGEVSLSVASGSHLGVGSHNQHTSSMRESTTALAGSITGNKVEVQVDILSETASCVSEKSGVNDSVSTKALAGSLMNYKQSTDPSSVINEDESSSERVRFDSTICYVIDGKDSNADKSSLGSGRSFRSSERSFRDDADSSSMSSSFQKKIIQRIPKLNNSQHRNLSLDSNNDVNISEKLEDELSMSDREKPFTNATPTINLDNLTEKTQDNQHGGVVGSPTTSSKSNRNLSKTKILRNLFFSQKSDNNDSSKS